MSPLARCLLPVLLVGTLAPLAEAHGPQPPITVRRSDDLASRIQRRLPVPYRERYNRPRYVTGRIAYWIAPSSQEAMVWHRHVHRGTYDRHHAPPTRDLYLFPKPWEVLPTGARPANSDRSHHADHAPEMIPPPAP